MHPYIIAEIGVNWATQDTAEQNFVCAKALIDAAKAAGADAAKFQTFSAERLAGANAPKAAYQQRNDARDNSQYAMLKRLELPREWHAPLQAHCAAVGIDFLSSAFSAEDARFLTDTLGMRVVKIGSGELTNAMTLLAASQAGARVILSTGMATLAEVVIALGVLAYGYLHPKNAPVSSQAFADAFASEAGQRLLEENVTLLQCTSNYPCALTDANVLSMQTLAQRFGLAVGLSDHTEGHHAAVAATALGAQVIEKHFTLSRNAEGPDHQASLEPDSFARFVREIRATAQALGTTEKAPLGHEAATAAVVRQMLITTRAIRKDEAWEMAAMTTQRTGKMGIAPLHAWDIAGRAATRNYAAGEMLDAREL